MIDAATQAKGKGKIGAVDCTQQRTLCSKYGVTGFPTLKKFGEDKEKPEDYQGDRSVEDMVGFVSRRRGALSLSSATLCACQCAGLIEHGLALASH